MNKMPEIRVVVNEVARRLTRCGTPKSSRALYSPTGALAVTDSFGGDLAEAGWSLVDAGNNAEGLLYILYAEFARSAHSAARRGELCWHPGFSEYVPHALLDIASKPSAGLWGLSYAVADVRRRLGVAVPMTSHVRHGVWNEAFGLAA